VVRIKEPFNGISHLAGAAASVLVTVLMVRQAALRGGAAASVPFVIYGASMVLLYLASGTYHLLDVGARAHVLLRRFDHISISLLIAGTYTPVCLTALKGTLGSVVCWVVWGLAAAVMLTDVFWLEAPRGIKTTLYVVLGWVAIGVFVPLERAVGWAGIAWMLAGGVVYSAGALLYALKKPDPWPRVVGFHGIWHLFVLGGSACLAVMVWRYVLPLVTAR
jgi:hemolysin III